MGEGLDQGVATIASHRVTTSSTDCARSKLWAIQAVPARRPPNAWAIISAVTGHLRTVLASSVVVPCAAGRHPRRRWPSVVPWREGAKPRVRASQLSSCRAAGATGGDRRSRRLPKRDGAAAPGRSPPAIARVRRGSRHRSSSGMDSRMGPACRAPRRSTASLRARPVWRGPPYRACNRGHCVAAGHRGESMHRVPY